MITVGKNGGAIDRSGKVLVEFIYDEAPEDFHNGRAAVKPKERDKAADFIDTRGKTIFSTKYNDLFSGRKVFKLGLLGDKDINGELVMSQRTAYAFPVAKLQLFMPDFDWKDADVDEIFYTDLRKGDIELASLSWKYGDVFVYGNKRFFDYGQTDEQVLFEGFRGADGNFKIIRYR
ncbi:WG repeat-containing protein [Draconibacterium orientale]|uniref:WG repeat-containing protein n=1 Tax=Draconibacterium orientale TaxID=1168034 RepID=UPI002ABD27B6|nr:WG repeat-containing protein [Draconibacterium orientale]